MTLGGINITETISVILCNFQTLAIHKQVKSVHATPFVSTDDNRKTREEKHKSDCINNRYSLLMHECVKHILLYLNLLYLNLLVLKKALINANQCFTTWQCPALPL